jgi:chaperone required for assembly of F1-ATPase
LRRTNGQMSDIFTEIFENPPLDPTEAAQRAVRPNLRKRFFKHARIGHVDAGGVAIFLDGKPVLTPARRKFVAPAQALAEAVAAEWEAQADVIDPARMPLTRLCNAVIDAVTDAPAPVAEEVARYLRSDMLFYRAEAPAALARKQSQAWDPVLAWARERFGAHFVLTEGLMYVSQQPDAIAAARAAIPYGPWQLAAISSITTLTGSALLALALAHSAIEPDAAWLAAHVDEDWQMSQWGCDELALERRGYRHGEFRAAVTVLRLAG